MIRAFAQCARNTFPHLWTRGRYSLLFIIGALPVRGPDDVQIRDLYTLFYALVLVRILLFAMSSCKSDQWISDVTQPLAQTALHYNAVSEDEPL